MLATGFAERLLQLSPFGHNATVWNGGDISPLSFDLVLADGRPVLAVSSAVAALLTKARM